MKISRFTAEQLKTYVEERKKNDEFYTSIEEKTLELGEILNKIHEVNFGANFWKMLLFDYVESHFKARNKDKEPHQGKTTRKKIFHVPNFLTIAKDLRKFWNYVKLKLLLKSKNKILIKKPLPRKDFPAGLFINEFKPIGVPKKNNRTIDAIENWISKNDDKELGRLLSNLPPYASKYFDWYISKVKIVNPQNKSFHVSIFSEPFMKVFLGLYRETGAKVHRYQHGSHYGEMHNFGYSEFINSDFFHTWGWKHRTHDIPDKSYRLQKFEQIYRKNELKKKEYDLVILTGTPDPRYVEKENDKLEYLLRKIDRAKYQSIIVRPRPVSKYKLTSVFDSTIKKYGLEKDKAVRHIAQTVSLSEVVVHLQGPSTTLLECFYVNHPIISFFNFNPIPSKEVIPYYSYFFSKGIYHDDAKSMVKHLNEIRGVKEWWSTILMENNYLDFKYSYCRKF